MNLNDESVDGLFELIHKWIDNNAAQLKSILNTAVSETDLKNIETELNIQMPKSLRTAYLIHNGESSESDGLFGLWRWLPLNELKDEFKLLNEHDDSDVVRIPFLLSPGGDIFYVETGEESEVMEWWHEKPTRDVKHGSFKEFLSWFICSLKEGKFVYLADEMNGLIDESEL